MVYTALGHAASNFTDDSNFRAHVRDALAWLPEGMTGIGEGDATGAFMFPNPTNDQLQLHVEPIGPNSVLSVIDASGRTVLRERMTKQRSTISTTKPQPGSYTVVLDDGMRVPLLIVR